MLLLLLACTDPEPPPPGAVAEPPACDGAVEVVAGIPGVGGAGLDGLPATDTWLYLPQDAAARGGTWWIADYNNHVVREIGPDGVARRVAGSGFPSGGEGGPALDEPLDHPTMVVPDPDDDRILWIAATGNHRIGRLDRTASWLDFPFGTGFEGFDGDGGPAAEAWFFRPSSLAFDHEGTMYVSDRMNQVVRAIGPDGVIRTVVGTPGVEGYAGDGGPADEALLSAPAATEADPANRLDVLGDRLVLADTGNGAVREADLATGTIRTLAAGLEQPHDVAIGPDGTVYVAETGAHCVRAIDPDGGVTTVAGTCGEAGPAEPIATPEDARFSSPVGVALDPEDRVLVADRDNHVIRRFCVR